MTPPNSTRAIEYAIRSGRALVHPDIAFGGIEAATPSALPADIQLARVASIDARSEAIRIREQTTVVLDDVLVRWLYALWRFQQDHTGKHWLMFFLYHYFTLRIVSSGLFNEARAFNHRFRPEMRLLRRDEGTVDLSSVASDTRKIEAFMLGHELGHVAYKHGGASIATLRASVVDCASELTRLLRVTFTGDRSTLTAVDLDPRYEDIVKSVEDYLNRYVFHEFADDIRKYERDLRQRGDWTTIHNRSHRYEVFADIFEEVDFVEEAFCDIYALEFRLLEAGQSRTVAAAIALECWQNLHAMFGLTAMDSLARDRLVAARDHLDRKASSDRSRQADRALLHYQVAMIKAVYRRVVFMNYIARHPLLNGAEVTQALGEAGEKLEGQYIGACASIRFNGIRLEMDEGVGFGDVPDEPSRADLDRLWEDLVARVPGMGEVEGLRNEDPQLRGEHDRVGGRDGGYVADPYSCQFCGASIAESRLIVTSGHASICERCILVAESSFAAMPPDRPRRTEVTYGILTPVPDVDRADPAQPHCRFCEMAPAPGEPLVSGGTAIICAICTEAAARIVRDKAPGADPAYFDAAEVRIDELLKTAEEMPTLREMFLGSAISKREEVERERNPGFPGRPIWRLFAESTVAPFIPTTAAGA